MQQRELLFGQLLLRKKKLSCVASQTFNRWQVSRVVQ
uniref:Uncharacterized protein n=1 Tax=Anguilla anguilla TaxID=7936 RepID=A0A0E9WWH2_ANGAN